MSIPQKRLAASLCLACLLALCGCGSAPSSPPAPTEEREPAAAPEVAVVEQRLEVEPTVDAGLEVVRRYTRMFYAGELDSLRQKFSSEMREEFPEGRLELMRDRVRTNLGEETEVVGEDFQLRDDYRGFVRWARFSKHDGLIEVQWILREDDTIAGFMIREARPGGQKPPAVAE